jgi:CRP-like cAMP-binding protein
VSVPPALLARSPLFAAMPRAALEAMAARAVRRRVRRGQRALGKDPAVVVLLTGRLEVIGGDGEVVRSLLPPAAAGVSLAVGAAATAELRAAEDCEVVTVPADAIAATLRRDPGAAIAAVLHLAGVVAALSGEVEVLRRHGLAARLRHCLAALGRGRREISITHARLASEVGGTRANVSRALAKLEEEGTIRRRRGRIELISAMK